MYRTDGKSKLVLSIEDPVEDISITRLWEFKATLFVNTRIQLKK